MIQTSKRSSLVSVPPESLSGWKSSDLHRLLPVEDTVHSLAFLPFGPVRGESDSCLPSSQAGSLIPHYSPDRLPSETPRLHLYLLRPGSPEAHRSCTRLCNRFVCFPSLFLAVFSRPHCSYPLSPVHLRQAFGPPLDFSNYSHQTLAFTFSLMHHLHLM